MKQRIYSGLVCRLVSRKKVAVPFLVVLLLVASCGDVSSTADESFDPAKAAQAWNTADKTWYEDELRILESGKSLYQGRCAGCHQQTGSGSTTIGAPALKGSAVARGSVDTLIGTVLFGRATMPAFRHSLEDIELAMVLSYLRNAWGNDILELVQASKVAAIRASGQP